MLNLQVPINPRLWVLTFTATRKMENRYRQFEFVVLCMALMVHVTSLTGDSDDRC